MHIGQGIIKELTLWDGMTAAWIACPPNLIPAPGQYLLAHAAGSDAPLPASVFAAGFQPGAFLAAPPVPGSWTPGMRLNLRGPLGRGFSLPANARRVALIAWNGHAGLLSLVAAAFEQGAALTFLADNPPEELPLQIESQPLSAVDEVMEWADYAALGVDRAELPEIRERFGALDQARVGNEAQVLVSAPMPCGGVAECGVCAVQAREGWRMACKDGPVFNLRGLISTRF